LRSVLIFIGLLFLFTFKGPLFALNKPPNGNIQNLPKLVLRKIRYQIEVKDYLGAVKDTDRLWKTTSNVKVKEIAFLLHWEALGFYHYKTKQFQKILEDIGGLNLYWSFFGKKPHYTDLYYEILGKLYTLLFQYRRAVIFLIEAYKLKPNQERLLDIIYAVEMTFYNEIRPYYNFEIIKKLLDKVNPKELDIFQKALYDFEKGFYYFLIKNYALAYKLFKSSYDLDRAFLTDGQANYFMGRALEGAGRLKDAYYYYKLALKQVKHPLFKQRTLYRLFIVSAKLHYYQEANDYLYGLTTFGGIRVNPFLQEALLKIPLLDSFLNHFYWKKDYPAIVSQIMWLNFNNDRGRRAFKFFLETFLGSGSLYPDFKTAWRLYYPHEVRGIKIQKEKVLKLSYKGLRNLVELYGLNKALFLHFFGNYGYLALAKYYFYVGNWKRCKEFLKLAKLDLPIKHFLKGVIEAYEGRPYELEIYYPTFKGELKTEALFWLGWGYLINGRWDLVGLYWDRFLEASRRKEQYNLQRLFASYYLGIHLLRKGYLSQGANYLKETLKVISKLKTFKGLKRFTILKLAEVEGLNSTLTLMQSYNLTDKEWQRFLKYLFMLGVKK